MSYEQSWPVYQQPVYQYGTSYPVRRTAPASVHVVAILQYIGGVAAIAGAVFLAILGVDARRQPSRPNVDVMTAEGAALLLWILAGFFLVCGIIAIVLGRKLQRGRQWARVLLIVLDVLSILGIAYQSATKVITGDPRPLASLIVPVLYLVLLNTSAVRSWCRAHTY